MGADPAGRALREAAVRRRAALDERGELTSEHVRLTATAVGAAERTVWRWVARARAQVTPAAQGRFEIDDRLRARLAYHRGNAAALHRELVAEATSERPAPSEVTVQRAVRRDLTAGERAGLRRGERERRKFDVFLRRPALHRNAAWEADHVEAPVEVEVGGRLVKPWVTWFLDTAHNAIAGTAVTPGPPSRESILAALRAALLRTDPYGPVGGLPALVRVDQGKDFLSRTVGEALGAFAVRLVPLPGYTPHLKGTVETVNGAVEKMLFAQLPRYTHAQTLASGAVVDPDAPALTFEAFTAELLAWVAWWNTVHTMDELGGASPAASWLADPSPVDDVDADLLWMSTLEDDRKTRRITGKGAVSPASEPQSHVPPRGGRSRLPRTWARFIRRGYPAGCSSLRRRPWVLAAAFAGGEDQVLAYVLDGLAVLVSAQQGSARAVSTSVMRARPFLPRVTVIAPMRPGSRTMSARRLR